MGRSRRRSSSRGRSSRRSSSKPTKPRRYKLFRGYLNVGVSLPRATLYGKLASWPPRGEKRTEEKTHKLIKGMGEVLLHPNSWRGCPQGSLPWAPTYWLWLHGTWEGDTCRLAGFHSLSVYLVMSSRVLPLGWTLWRGILMVQDTPRATDRTRNRHLGNSSAKTTYWSVSDSRSGCVRLKVIISDRF